MTPELWSSVPHLRRYRDRLSKNLTLRPANERTKFTQQIAVIERRIQEVKTLYFLHHYGRGF